MAISRLASQDAAGTSATTSVSATYPGATTAGNLLVASLYTITATSTVTFPSGFSAFSEDFSAGAQSVHVCYKIATGSETTITASATGSSQMRIHIYEYTGNANPVSTDGNTGATSATTNVTTINSGNITTTNANDLLFVACATGGSSSAQSFSNSFNLRQTDAINIRLFDADQIVAATSTYSTAAAWTTSLRAGIVFGTFKAATVASTIKYITYRPPFFS